MKEKKEENEKMNGWLYGWKDISSYVGCDEKTLRSWEKDFDFPIVRPARGRPMALPKRIDNWVDSFNKSSRA